MSLITTLNVITFLILSAVLIQKASGVLKDGECEVCIKFLTKFEKTLSDTDRKDSTEKLKKACAKAKDKDNRFCYFIGGTSDAATFILNEVTKPLAYYKPIPSICEALKKKDKQICELAYEKEFDWKNIDLKKLKVKDLKKILDDWGESCNGCIEKTDYMRKVESVMHNHVEL